MTSPKHLWSGAWEQESAASAEELARRRQEERPAPEERPAQPPPRPVRAPGPGVDEARGPVSPPGFMWTAALIRATRARLRTINPRVALTVGLAALAAVAAAYGLGALIGSATNDKPSGPTPWLGIQMESLPLGGVVIATVTPGSPAESAGLEPGDVITEFDKRPVGAVHDVTAALNDLHAGEQVMIEVSRGSTSYTALVTLRKRPPGFP